MCNSRNPILWLLKCKSISQQFYWSATCFELTKYNNVQNPTASVFVLFCSISAVLSVSSPFLQFLVSSHLLMSQPDLPVLRVGLLAFEGVLSPHSLRVDELALPGQDVAVQVGDQLVLVVTHAWAEVSDAHVRLLGPAQVWLRDQHVTHGQHAQAAQLLKSQNTVVTWIALKCRHETME